jgi:hypothetical protein
LVIVGVPEGDGGRDVVGVELGDVGGAEVVGGGGTYW